MNEPDQKSKILLIEDDPDGRQAVNDALLDSGYDVLAAESGQQGLEFFSKQAFDVVLSDIKLPDTDGIQVLKQIRQADPDMPVLLMTAYGTIQAAVEALKAGAYDYILKPLDLADLQSKIGRAIETRRLRSQVFSLKQELFARPIIAKSGQMLSILKQVRTIAPTQANVLILGESGTGKELVARALHALGKNPEGPLIAVNCGAFAETLLESELFGHEKGAFTGANQMRQGAFERAHGGTLFLDEVGLASAQVQSRLLRVLEEREIMRVGGSKSISIDVRIIAASNRDLEELVKEKKFRPDLLYRLQVITISLPPLRARPEDIRPLAGHFIAIVCKENGRRFETIEPDFYAALEKHDWPGNVRELRNVIESAVILATAPKLTAANLNGAKISPGSPQARPPQTVLPSNMEGEAVLSRQQNDTKTLHLAPFEADTKLPPSIIGKSHENTSHPTSLTLAEIERHAILGALQRHKGNRTLAAEELNISTRTIQRKIKDYNLPF